MAKQKLRAQVQYQKLEDGREGFAINIYSNGEWGLNSWYPLVAREGGDGEKAFIHCDFVQKLAEMKGMGYEIDL